MLLRRRTMMPKSSGGSSILPSGYQQVNCISIPYGGVLRTSVIPKITNAEYSVDFRLDTELSDISSSATIFGSRTGDSAFALLSVFSSDSGFLLQWCSTSWVVLGTKDNNRHVISFDISDNTATLDGTAYAMGYTPRSTNQPSAPITFAGRITANGRSFERFAALTLCGAEAKESGEYVYQLIPCLQESNGEYGMYDLVTNTFLGNVGSGTITEGVE